MAGCRNGEKKNECYRKLAGTLTRNYQIAEILKVITDEEADPDIPHIFLRNKWIWLLSNVVGFVLVKSLGIERLRKLGLYQPILKS